MAVGLPEHDSEIINHYLRLKVRSTMRERTMETIHQVRQGNITQLFPEELQFSLSFNGSPVANFVDVVARDMAEGIAPLPALACVSGKMESDADLKRAERKNRIGDNYWRRSKLEIQMLTGADRYVSYGFLPFFIEPDLGDGDDDDPLPYIHLENPRFAYYELDRYGRVRVYAYRWLRNIDELCAMFPEHASEIRQDPKTGRRIDGETRIEMIRWVDKQNVTLILPERNGLVLNRYAHKLDCAPVVIAQRPGEDDSPRGQFDDVIWVQVARSIMSTLALEAANIAVQAPIAAPADLDELPIGPHAILQSENSDKIKKLNLELPPAIFAEGQLLDQELKTGARYPDARTGGIQGASVITGKGVEALLGTFDAQIKGAQMIFKEALQEVTAVCFKMDEAWWPNKSKTVNGTLSGASYEFSYVPSKDINGRHACTVTYGFAAGMQPSQSIVTLLQLEGAGLVAKSTTQENLPFSIDHMQEQKKINVEGWREALKQGLFAYLQAAGQVAAQGGDPTPQFTMAVSVIRQLQNGVSVEEAVEAAYAQVQAQQQAKMQAQQDAAQQAQQGQPGQPGQAGPPGLDQGDETAVGQMMTGGGRPTLAQMVAGFRGNASLPINEFQVSRRVPTGVQ